MTDLIFEEKTSQAEPTVTAAMPNDMSHLFYSISRLKTNKPPLFRKTRMQNGSYYTHLDADFIAKVNQRMREKTRA